MFHVGQMVVCVDDRHGFSGTPMPLVKGTIYTVGGVYSGLGGINPDGTDCNLALMLEEVKNPDPLGYGEFSAARFRPVTKRNEEIIASMLIPVKDAVNA